jgi:hypothetical protein
MQFQHYDLGYRNTGEIVQVTLSGNAANVQLIDSSNFQSYRSGHRYQYFGGHATRSPVRIPIPHSGHWHVVIDLGGYSGTIRSSVSVSPAPYRLPEINQAPLSSIPSLLQGTLPSNVSNEPVREFDVFISHASEDKDAVVRPLANALRDGGLKVWYDEFELKIGDSLRRKIDAGLARSRFGVVVLSRSFFGKGWTNYELDGLVTRAVTGEQVLLPIWHDITKKELIEYSPSLADKVARSTGTHTVEEIAAEIIEVIRNA